MWRSCTMRAEHRASQCGLPQEKAPHLLLPSSCLRKTWRPGASLQSCPWAIQQDVLPNMTEPFPPGFLEPPIHSPGPPLLPLNLVFSFPVLQSTSILIFFQDPPCFLVLSSKRKVFKARKCIYMGWRGITKNVPKLSEISQSFVI